MQKTPLVDRLKMEREAEAARFDREEFALQTERERRLRELDAAIATAEEATRLHAIARLAL